MAEKKSSAKGSTNTKMNSAVKTASKKAAKKATKKAANAAVKNAKKEIKKVSAEKPQREPYTPTMTQRILPYLYVLFALILAVAFVIVHIAGLESEVGVIGYYAQGVFCGMLGWAAFAIPLALGYCGVKQCVFHIKWNPKNIDEENKPDFLRARKKLIRSKVFVWVSLILLSALAGVIAEQESLALGDFWREGLNCIGGGIIGGSFGALFILCFDIVISIIILSVILIVFILLAVGITPDYIVSRIREAQIARAERRAAERELLRNAPEPAPVVKQRPEIRPESSAKPQKKPQNMNVDQILDDDYGKPDPIEPVMTKKLSSFEVPIGPATNNAITKKEGASEKAEDKPEKPTLDFGGEPGFDTEEYNSFDDIIGSFGIPIAPAKSEEVQKPVALEKKEEPIAEKPVTQQPPQNQAPAIKLDLTQIDGDEFLEDMAAVTPDEADGTEEPEEIVTPYVFPPFDLLNENKNAVDADYSEELQTNAKILVETLRSFKVGVREVNYSRGPTITRYELKPEVGTRVRSIANLVDDIALNLATSGVRIEAPIPNKAAVGIEVPNKVRNTVYLRDLIENNKFLEAKSRLTSCLGMDVGGNPIYFDVAKMPHLLIAGTTGSGKSVCINSVIISILYKAKPEDVKLILIDPKKVEFNIYKNIPHLYCPIVSEPKKAAGALASAVTEMERRFELIESVGVRNIADYNMITENDPDMEYMPQMVIIIDELADLMMTAREEVETNICRLAQKARAAGIHVILGTQRPSVDVITGLIKANVPSRIACTVTSQVDSRTIIDVAGAENLIGYGDMLFAPVGSAKPLRVQGAFVTDSEVEKIVNFICDNNGGAKFNKEFIQQIELEAAKCGQSKKGASSASDAEMPEIEGGDSKFRDAVKLAIEEGKISTSLMQRRLGVGYGRAAKIIDTMEQMGYVSKPDGNKPRRVLITMEEYMRRVVDGNLGEVQD